MYVYEKGKLCDIIFLKLLARADKWMNQFNLNQGMLSVSIRISFPKWSKCEWRMAYILRTVRVIQLTQLRGLNHKNNIKIKES